MITSLPIAKNCMEYKASIYSVSSVLQSSMLAGMEVQTFPDRLIQRIKELGISQAEFARRVGVSTSHMNQMVQGKIALPRPEVRRRIARELDISHLDLLILAGELLPEEVPEPGAPAPRPEPREVAELLDQIKWDHETTRQVRGFLDFMRRQQAGELG